MLSFDFKITSYSLSLYRILSRLSTFSFSTCIRELSGMRKFSFGQEKKEEEEITMLQKPIIVEYYITQQN